MIRSASLSALSSLSSPFSQFPESRDWADSPGILRTTSVDFQRGWRTSSTGPNLCVSPFLRSPSAPAASSPAVGPVSVPTIAAGGSPSIAAADRTATLAASEKHSSLFLSNTRQNLKHSPRGIDAATRYRLSASCSSSGLSSVSPSGKLFGRLPESASGVRGFVRDGSSLRPRIRRVQSETDMQNLSRCMALAVQSFGKATNCLLPHAEEVAVMESGDGEGDVVGSEASRIGGFRSHFPLVAGVLVIPSPRSVVHGGFGEPPSPFSPLVLPACSPSFPTPVSPFPLSHDGSSKVRVSPRISPRSKQGCPPRQRVAARSSTSPPPLSVSAPLSPPRLHVVPPTAQDDAERSTSAKVIGSSQDHVSRESSGDNSTTVNIDSMTYCSRSNSTPSFPAALVQEPSYVGGSLPTSRLSAAKMGLAAECGVAEIPLGLHLSPAASVGAGVSLKAVEGAVEWMEGSNLDDAHQSPGMLCKPSMPVVTSSQESMSQCSEELLSGKICLSDCPSMSLPTASLLPEETLLSPGKQSLLPLAQSVLPAEKSLMPLEQSLLGSRQCADVLTVNSRPVDLDSSVNQRANPPAVSPPASTFSAIGGFCFPSGTSDGSCDSADSTADSACGVGDKSLQVDQMRVDRIGIDHLSLIYSQVSAAGSCDFGLSDCGTVSSRAPSRSPSSPSIYELFGSEVSDDCAERCYTQGGGADGGSRWSRIATAISAEAEAILAAGEGRRARDYNQEGVESDGIGVHCLRAEAAALAAAVTEAAAARTVGATSSGAAEARDLVPFCDPVVAGMPGLVMDTSTAGAAALGEGEGNGLGRNGEGEGEREAKGGEGEEVREGDFVQSVEDAPAGRVRGPLLSPPTAFESKGGLQVACFRTSDNEPFSPPLSSSPFAGSPTSTPLVLSSFIGQRQTEPT